MKQTSNTQTLFQDVENLLASGRTDQARDVLQSLIEREPRNFETWYWLGVCAKLEGDFEEAEAAFRRVVDEIPNHEKALYGLGLVLESKGDTNGAIQAYRRAASINPSFEHALQKLAQHNVHIPGQDKGIIDYQKLGDSYSELESLLESGEWEKADQQTRDILYQIVGESNIQPEEINKIPCDKLAAIDRLWVSHSEKRFGFSIQKKIYQNVGGLISRGGRDATTFDWFSKRIAWHTTKKTNFRKRGNALKGRKHITYSLAAPVGHLPAAWVLSKKDLLVPQDEDSSRWSMAGGVVFYVIWAAVMIGVFGIFGAMLSGDESGAAAGAALGFVVSLHVPLQTWRRARERKRGAKAEDKIMAMFNRTDKCSL